MKIKCPWCGNEGEAREGEFEGPYGKIKEKRCGVCGNLISTRLEGIPEEIIKEAK